MNGIFYLVGLIVVPLLDSELPVAVIGLPIPEKNTILRNDNDKLLPVIDDLGFTLCR